LRDARQIKELAMYKLYARPGWGSAIVEAQLAWYGLPYETTDVADLFKSAESREHLAKINPIHQVPTLILPDGSLMTESAAITLHLADATGSTDLVPAPGEVVRPRFLRWLVFLVANVYPTFTYADDPSRFVPTENARDGYKGAVSAYREKLWAQVEADAAAPWFLGDRFSALDIYAATMTRWTPKKDWFAGHCPRLTAIAKRADDEPRLAAVWARNFPSAS